jgi:CRP-like cAMP-binding protein
MSPTNRIQLLNSVALFGGLEAPMLAELAPRLRPKSYAGGASVFVEGEPCRDLYILAEGRVKFSRMNVDGREQILKIFDRMGDTFCLASAFSTGTHIVTGTAATATNLLLLNLDVIREFVRHQPAVGLKLASIAGEHLRHLVDLADDLALKSATTRLAKHLHEAAMAQGAAGSGVRLRREDYREEELAARLGTVRVNVSRILANLVRGGAIALERDAIVVRDMESLRRIAQGY